MREIKAEILWASGYYDGALNGMCLVEGRMCWYDVVPGTEDDWNEELQEYNPRRYYVYELSDREVRILTTEHFRFELYIGNYRTCNHIVDPPRGLHPKSEWSKFYDNHETIDPVGDKNPIGILI